MPACRSPSASCSEWRSSGGRCFSGWRGARVAGVLRCCRGAVRRLLPMVEGVGVADRLDVPVEGLSGGQLQRVLLALALEPHPELLLLDEPASGIDFKDLQLFYDLLAGLNDETGVTILLVSHDLQTLGRFAHHVFCLRNGVIAC